MIEVLLGLHLYSFEVDACDDVRRRNSVAGSATENKSFVFLLNDVAAVETSGHPHAIS